MPHGTIHSYDADEQAGRIQPQEEAADLLPFTLDVVRDYHQGDVLQLGDRVTYTAEEGTVTSIHRVAPRGYQ